MPIAPLFARLLVVHNSSPLIARSQAFGPHKCGVSPAPTAHPFYFADPIIAHLLWRTLTFRFLLSRRQHSMASIDAWRGWLHVVHVPTMHLPVGKTRRGRHTRTEAHRGDSNGGLRAVEELDQIGDTRIRSSNVHRGIPRRS